MPFQEEIQLNHVSISFWRIQEREDEMLMLLPEGYAYAEHIASFKSEKRRKEWLATRCLLHRRLGEETTIEYLPTGRPVLRTNPKNAEISVSHTGDWAALAVSFDGERVGLDMERLSGRAFRVRQRFLNVDESSLVTDETEASRLWSAKEAIYKLCDKEGMLFLGDMILRKEGDELLAKLPTMGKEAVVSTMLYEDCVVSVARFR